MHKVKVILTCFTKEYLFNQTIIYPLLCKGGELSQTHCDNITSVAKTSFVFFDNNAGLFHSGD